MKIVYAEEFWKQFRKLPPEIQRLYRRQENLFKKDWRDPRLHIKKVRTLSFAFFFPHHSGLSRALYLHRY